MTCACCGSKRPGGSESVGSCRKLLQWNVIWSGDQETCFIITTVQGERHANMYVAVKMCES